MSSGPAPASDVETSQPPAADLETDEAVEVPVPQDQAGIDELRLEIDAIDAELVRLIQRRTAISHAIGTARKSLGGPRIVYSREMAILERFRSLGPGGHRPGHDAALDGPGPPRPQIAPPPVALINYDGADEVVDSCPTSPKSTQLISAVEVDQRGGS